MPDILSLAEAYGVPAIRVADHDDLDAAIAATLSTPGPALCEVMMPAQQVFMPKVQAQRLPDGRIVSKPLEDMFPFLDRDEFMENMLVRTVGLLSDAPVEPSCSPSERLGVTND